MKPSTTVLAAFLVILILCPPIFGAVENTSKGKILMVLPKTDYQELEFDQPREYFIAQGYDVDVASKDTDNALGSNGGSVTVDLDIRHVDLSGYKSVVFVGGMGIDYLNTYEDSDYQNIARNAASKDLVIGAICLAPKILAAAGLLEGVEATSSDPGYIESKGAVFVDQPVVISDKIVTGNGPYAAAKFAKSVVEVMER